MRLNVWCRLLFFALIVVMAAPVASAGIILSLDPSSQSVALGSQATMDLNISGLGDPPSLGTFDVNITFDLTTLSFSNFSFGDPVLGCDELDPTCGGNTINFINPGVGTVELFDLSLDSDTTLNALQPSSFILGVLTFDTLGTGASSVDVTINALGDADGNSLSASIQNGSVSVSSVSSVPEPPTIYLLGSALFAMAILRHRFLLSSVR